MIDYTELEAENLANAEHRAWTRGVMGGQEADGSDAGDVIIADNASRDPLAEREAAKRAADKAQRGEWLEELDV